MHVLEGQMQIVVRTQLTLQEIGDLAALGVGQARDGEFGHQLLLGCVGSTQRLPVADRAKPEPRAPARCITGRKAGTRTSGIRLPGMNGGKHE
ncbi:Uncharacterised protein [Mycobacteroides abscessus subsp. abscessus]|nr:Uncharacterised protein [Mycobacteroides abscessus subsp. abscessus]